MNTGIVTGAIFQKKVMKSQPAFSAMRRFCGSPTRVVTPPSAVPTAPCMIRLRKKDRNCSSCSAFSGSTPSSLVWSCPSAASSFPEATLWYTEKNPTATVISTAVTVSASRNAESTAPAKQNRKDNKVFDLTSNSIRVKTNSSMSRIK